jgi:protein-L-isoaspartate(D-aspartate) O-methyltransferase
MWVQNEKELGLLENNHRPYGRLLSLLATKHEGVQRDYLARVNDPEWPKWKAAELAKKFDFDYWDGSRKINYGGYTYKPGYWTPIAQALINEFALTKSSKVLDVGCGKGFLLFELTQLIPGIQVQGVDISSYAIENSHLEVKSQLRVSNATSLPFQDKEFDLAVSINTLHNLYNFELADALREFSRVSKEQYLCVESYRNEREKANLLYWQVTCEAFNTPEEWFWWFQQTGYYGDYEFIYFS